MPQDVVARTTKPGAGLGAKSSALHRADGMGRSVSRRAAGRTCNSQASRRVPAIESACSAAGTADPKIRRWTYVLCSILGATLATAASLPRWTSWPSPNAASARRHAVLCGPGVAPRPSPSIPLRTLAFSASRKPPLTRNSDPHFTLGTDNVVSSRGGRPKSLRPPLAMHLAGSSLIGIDLFSGAGGMSLGARRAGLTVGLAVENDPIAARTYRSNHSDTKLLTCDIRKVDHRHLAPWLRFARRLIVFAGPPCQGFSWSNSRTRNASNPTNWLFEESVRIIKILKPEWIVFENVRGIVDTCRGLFLRTIRSHLESDYSLTSALLNAMHYGVPQDRTRFFLVGSRSGTDFSFPSVLHTDPITLDEAIRDLPSLPNGASESWQRYGAVKPSSYASKLRSNQEGCPNHLVTRNADTVIERYSYVPQGGNWKCIPRHLMGNYKDVSRCHTGIYRRLDPQQPSTVIGNFRKNMLVHPYEDRGISVREAARIQSFPDAYRFHGSIGFQQQQVANAVPPMLAESVFGSIRRSVEQ